MYKLNNLISRLFLMTSVRLLPSDNVKHTLQPDKQQLQLNNLVSDIRKILSGKRTFVGKHRNDDSKSIAVKFCETEDCIIETASCRGVKSYQMVSTEYLWTKDFAWCYIDLLSLLAYSIRCKKALSTAKAIRI